MSSVLEVFVKGLMGPKIFALELEPHIHCHQLSYSNESEQSGLTSLLPLVTGLKLNQLHELKLGFFAFLL